MRSVACWRRAVLVILRWPGKLCCSPSAASRKMKQPSVTTARPLSVATVQRSGAIGFVACHGFAVESFSIVGRGRPGAIVARACPVRRGGRHRGAIRPYPTPRDAKATRGRVASHTIHDDGLSL
jgi:hypothetical protein